LNNIVKGPLQSALDVLILCVCVLVNRQSPCVVRKSSGPHKDGKGHGNRLSAGPHRASPMGTRENLREAKKRKRTRPSQKMTR